MPTYEYSCQKCGQTFEAFQSMRDEPFRECPKELCRLPKWGHGKVKRLLGTGAGLIFKGSGFYSTDYRSDSYKEAAKKDSAPKASEGGDKSPASKDTAKSPSPASLRQLRRNQRKNPPDTLASVARHLLWRGIDPGIGAPRLIRSAIFAAAR